MSEERMTDARALEIVDRYLPFTEEAIAAFDHITARLRSEAAPEGQAAQCEYPGCGRPAGHPCAYSKCQNLEPEQPAAPAPVAGDAVARLSIQWRHNAQGCGPKDQHAAGTWRSCARELEAALAQDRASQAGAAVPDGYALVPTHWRESLLASAGLLEAAKCPIDSLQAKALRKMAGQIAVAPTPAADREVRDVG